MSYNLAQIIKLIQAALITGETSEDDSVVTPLSDAIDLDSSETAATSKAVKILNDKINKKWEAVNATATRKGIVTIGENITVASGKISVENASVEQKGVVELSNDVDNTDKLKAATPYAVNRVYKIAKSVKYEICEVYYFLNPTIKNGFVPAYGGIIANANMNCPEAWEFLQSEEGQHMCCSEQEWQRRSTERYFQKENGEWESWNGIGGVPKFVLNVNKYTIRVPDLRGMYPEAIGLSYNGVPFEVGEVHYDMIRTLFGHINIYGIPNETDKQLSGVFRSTPSGTGFTLTQGTKFGLENLIFDANKTIPTGSYTAPRAYGVIPLVYMGV